MPRSSLLVLLAASPLCLGCDVEPDEGEALGPLALRTGDAEAGLVAFLADYEISTQAVLDVDCAIRSDSAAYIDQYRRGDDHDYGTADDQLIDSEATLDSIYFVGPSTIDRLYECAEAFGYVAPACGTTGNWSETFGSGDDWESLPQPIVDEIEAYWGLSYLCSPLYASGNDSFMQEVTVHYSDCDVQTYVITWVHTVEPGVQEIQTHDYDASFDLFDGSCEL